MNINVSENNGITTINIEGLLDSGSASQFNSVRQELINHGHFIVLLDMEQLEYISSAGLREILGLSKAIKTSKGKLALCNLQANVYEVFTISGFDTILDIYDNQITAMEALKTA